MIIERGRITSHWLLKCETGLGDVILMLGDDTGRGLSHWSHQFEEGLGNTTLASNDRRNVGRWANSGDSGQVQHYEISIGYEVMFLNQL